MGNREVGKDILEVWRVYGGKRENREWKGIRVETIGKGRDIVVFI